MEKKTIKSDRCISRYKPAEKEYSVKVEGCKRLFLLVKPDTSKTKNRKTWQYRYKSPTTLKNSKMSLGEYPQTTLAEVRSKWLEVDTILSNGVDPQQQRKEEKAEKIKAIQSTFKHFAWLHFDSIKKSQRTSTIKRKQSRYQLLCDYVGNEPIDSITAPRMLEVLLDIQKNSLNKEGKPTDKAERCAGIASEVFLYALARGYCSIDPSSMIKSQLAKYEYKHRPAIIKPLEFADMLKKIDATEAEINTKNSLRLLSMLFVRNGDLRHAKWDDFNLNEGKWYLKPMKGRGKEKMVSEMVIPLPTQAINILKEQHQLNGHTEYVFFSASSKYQIISDSTASKLLKELGYQDIHCPHGFRASAKTMLQEYLKYQAVYVEMALGHITKDQNGTAYGRFTFLDERKEMMQHWANYLDELKGGQLIPFPKQA